MSAKVGVLGCQFGCHDRLARGIRGTKVGLEHLIAQSRRPGHWQAGWVPQGPPRTWHTMELAQRLT